VLVTMEVVELQIHQNLDYLAESQIHPDFMLAFVAADNYPEGKSVD